MCIAELCLSPPTSAVLSRDELVQQLGNTKVVKGDLAESPATQMLVVQTSSDTLGGSLGGVQRLTTDGGVLEGRVARSMLLRSGREQPSPASSVAGEEFVEDSDVDFP